jgi:hypothetical protein
VKYKSATIKTLWPAHRATSSKARWLGPFSIGLAIPGKLGSPNNSKKNFHIYSIFAKNFSYIAVKDLSSKH